MTATAACPFCSAPNVLEAPEAGRRVVCVRCGESFTPSAADLLADGVATTAPRPQEPPSAWQVFGPLLLLGALLGAFVFAVGLYSIFFPKKRQLLETAPPAAQVAPPSPERPQDFAGLSYLPADANVFAGVRPGALPPGRARALLREAGVPEEALATLDAAGLPLERIDQCVVGLSLTPGSLVPRAVVHLTTVAPVDVAALRKQLQATPQAALRGRPRFRASVRGVPVEWLVLGDRAHLFATDAADLTILPAAPPLKPGVAASFARLRPDAAAWLATDRADFSQLPTVTAAAALLKRPALAAKVGRARAAALSLTPDARTHLALEAADDAARAALRAELGAVEEGAWVTTSGAEVLPR